MEDHDFFEVSTSLSRPKGLQGEQNINMQDSLHLDQKHTESSSLWFDDISMNQEKTNTLEQDYKW